MPNIAEIYKKLADSRIFSKIDLKAAYHQIPLEEQSIELTAFTCEFGLYEYLSMPMEIKNAPAWFQRFMEETFRDFIERKVLSIFLGDTILHTESLSHHKEQLEQIFERTSKNFIKCSYNKVGVSGREHLISGERGLENRIEPNPDRAACLLKR